RQLATNEPHTADWPPGPDNARRAYCRAPNHGPTLSPHQPLAAAIRRFRAQGPYLGTEDVGSLAPCPAAFRPCLACIPTHHGSSVDHGPMTETARPSKRAHALRNIATVVCALLLYYFVPVGYDFADDWPGRI